MRTWLSILFSFLLAGTQTVLPLAVSTDDQASCACTACSPSSCCACSRAPVSQAAPLAPAQTITQTEVQWLAASTLQAMAAPARPAAELPPSHPSFSSIGRVPLYQRDCTYLV